MRYHFTPTKMAIIRRTKTIARADEDMDKLEPSFITCEIENGASIVEIFIVELKKINTDFPYETAVSHLGRYPR